MRGEVCILGHFGVQITDEGRSLYIGSFCPAMTSLGRYLEEAAFSISISSSLFVMYCKNTLITYSADIR